VGLAGGEAAQTAYSAAATCLPRIFCLSDLALLSKAETSIDGRPPPPLFFPYSQLVRGSCGSLHARIFGNRVVAEGWNMSHLIVFTANKTQ
jgi:hypothetical protein